MRQDGAVRIETPRWVSGKFAGILGRSKSLVAQYAELNISLVSGGLAYYVMLALAPMAIATGALAGVFIEPQQIQDAWSQLSADSPSSLKALDPAVSALVQLAQNSSAGSVTIATVSSAILAIYVAQKVVYGVHSVEDQIFVRQRSRTSLVMRGWSSLVALITIFATVALLVVVTLVPPFLKALGIGVWFRDLVSTFQWIVPIALVYFFVWFVLAGAAKGIRRITWRSPGLIVATLWIIGSIAVFGLYANLSSTVGSALVIFGAPIAILIWTFLVFLGFFLGSLIESQWEHIVGGKEESVPSEKTNEADQQ